MFLCFGLAIYLNRGLAFKNINMRSIDFNEVFIFFVGFFVAILIFYLSSKFENVKK